MVTESLPEADEALLWQQRARLALDAADMGSFVWYAETGHIVPDARMLELFGLPSGTQHTPADALEQLVHPEDRERYTIAVRDALDPRGDGSLSEEIRIVDAAGRVRWVAVHARATFAGDVLRPSRMAGVAADITLQKAANAKLLALNAALRARVREGARELGDQEERFRNLVETSAQIVWTCGPEGNVVEDSPSWRGFTGQSMDEYRGSGWLDAVHADDRGFIERNWLEAVRTGGMVDARLRLRHHSGAFRWMHVRAAPQRGEDGDVRGWVGMNTDITPALELDRELRQTRARLTVAEQHERRRIAEILHNDLQQRLFGLQLKLDSVRHAGFSHEEPERMTALSEQAVEWIRQTIDVVRRLSIDLNPPVLQGESMEDLLVWLQAQMLELHGLRVTLDLGSDLPLPDPETRILLFQTLRELLFNIVKHAGVRAARLSVDVDRARTHLVARVEDQGAGYDPSGPSDGAGSGGYGLTSIRDRLLLVEGDMHIQSAPGKGTTVTLRIPFSTSAGGDTTS